MKTDLLCQGVKGDPSNSMLQGNSESMGSTAEGSSNIVVYLCGEISLIENDQISS